MATLIRCLVSKIKGVRPKWYQAGAGDIYPSYVVMENDNDEVSLCGIGIGGQRPVGIVGCPSFHGLGSAFAAGQMLPVWHRGCGVVIYVLFDDGTNNTTIDRGTVLVTSLTDAGCVREWTYLDTQEQQDSFENVIGSINEEVTISGNTATFVQCRMSI